MAGAPPPVTFDEAAAKNPHLKAYVDRLVAAGKPTPLWVPVVSRDLKGKKPYDFLYPVGDPIFIHVLDDGGLFPRYLAVMPEVKPEERPLYEAVRHQAFLEAPQEKAPESIADYKDGLQKILARIMDPKKPQVKPLGAKKPVPLTQQQVDTMAFLLYRDLVEHGPIEPVMHDPWIEDIHDTGTKNLHVVHKVFGMVETNLRFEDVATLDRWIETMGERMGRPVSASRPIVDGALPNGSRINIIYSDDISKGGSSFTIRKFSDTPTAVTQLIAWGTYDARVAAYLWLCLQNGMSVFVAGETASGKTTTTNAILPFIKRKSKIMTAEDTPEVLPPHANWQQLITRDRGTKDSSVTMYDLLKAGLRSRPNYIIVGEIRGAEGAVAFQAMQTGHPTMATFHASSVAKLIQRFTSDPINVPLKFMPNLNVVLIQMAVYVHGKMLRRVLAVDEIEGYSKRTDTAITRQIFSWDSVKDKHMFSGRNNSYVLESLVAPKMGYSDRREVYKELDKRTWILEEMVRRKIFDYHVVQKVFFEYPEIGDAAIPFPVIAQYAAAPPVAGPGAAAPAAPGPAAAAAAVPATAAPAAHPAAAPATASAASAGAAARAAPPAAPPPTKQPVAPLAGGR